MFLLDFQWLFDVLKAGVSLEWLIEMAWALTFTSRCPLGCSLERCMIDQLFTSGPQG